MFFRSKSRYTVYTYGADILKTRAREIGEITPEIREIAEEMLRAMQLFDGIGLAGPQYGVNLRIVTLGIPCSDHGAVSPGEAALLPRMPMTVINPEITAMGEAKDTEAEACLSVPGISAPVERSQFIQFRARTINGELIECECGGMLARCLQHEIDHLDGILFVDRLTEDVFSSIEPKLKRLKKNGRKKDFKKTILV
ncbi:MAG: peptide deformylase [Victivallaceae bacterium]|nr:peptide deformylase [Victivallaceae bacterium]